MADDDKNGPLVATGTTRSASAAFGDDSDESVESPVRKKQNTTTLIPDKSAVENSSSVARTSTNNDIETSMNDFPRDLDVDPIDGAVDVRNTALPRLSMDKEEEGLLDIVPPTSTALTKPTAVPTTSNIMEIETKIPSPQNTEYDDLIEIQSADDMSADHCSTKSSKYENGHVRNWRVGLGWVGISIFINLHVFSGMIWSGLLLNERATYQLESLEYRERLQLAYQTMGLRGEFEDMDENNFEKIEEQQFYWQELEAQARYWKKEAKKYQRDGEGFREQCREDLRHLLSELEPEHKGDNQRES